MVTQMIKTLPAMQETQARSPGEGNSYQLQYSCLEIPVDRGAWWATVHGVAKSRTRLSGTKLVILFLAFFFRNLHTVFHRSCANLHLQPYTEGFLFLHILANISYLWSFVDSHSDRCEVILHLHFNLHFPDD